MADKTMVLRKGSHWYVINSAKGDEQEIILTLLEYSEHQHFNIEKEDLFNLVDELGYTLEVFDDLNAA